MFEAVIQGVLLGGYYAVLAAGLSLMFGVVRFINLAHGDMAVLGAMIALWLVQGMGLGVGLAIAVTLPVMAALGWLMQWLIFDRALRGGFLIPILTTIGLGAALQNGMFGVFGSDTRSLGAYIGGLSWASWELPGGIFLGQLPVYMFATAVLVLGGLHLLLTRSGFGRAVRATSADAEAVALCGVDARSVHRRAAALAVALAGLAGIFLALRAQVTPFAGPMLLIFAFEAVVIGGIGSLRGTLIGGIALGVAQGLGGMISPQFSILAGHCVFLLVLAGRLLTGAAADRGGWRNSVAAMLGQRGGLGGKT
ncbi:MAG: branched-chain amino acid ABC transporter permease [Paracoccaceae bacterium]